MQLRGLPQGENRGKARQQLSTCWQIVECGGRRLALVFNSLSVVSESLNGDSLSSVFGTKSATDHRRKDTVLQELRERAISLNDLSAVVRALNSLNSLSIQSLGFNGLSAGRQSPRSRAGYAPCGGDAADARAARCATAGAMRRRMDAPGATGFEMLRLSCGGIRAGGRVLDVTARFYCEGGTKQVERSKNSPTFSTM
jgi:hypothetical protein